jgi:hypothetical protein
VQDIRILQQRSGSEFQYCVENLEEEDLKQGEEKFVEQEMEQYISRQQTQVSLE